MKIYVNRQFFIINFISNSIIGIQRLSKQKLQIAINGYLNIGIENDKAENKSVLYMFIIYLYILISL